MIGIPMVYIWLALTIIFVVAEIATTDICSIWFAAGALAATFVAWLTPTGAAVQVVVFIAVSAVTMYFTRPLLEKVLTKKTPTNMDMYIGQIAEVTADVNADTFGRAKLGGLNWQIKSSSHIAAGEKCKVVKIEGASLVVEKITVNS